MQLTKSQRLIFTHLMNYNGIPDKLFSHGQISKDLKISLTTVKKAIKILVENNIIALDKAYLPGHFGECTESHCIGFKVIFNIKEAMILANENCL